MYKKLSIASVVVIIALIVLFNSFFVVRQGQRALTLYLGELIKMPGGKAKIYNPGLHFNIPFVVSVLKFDVRIQNIDAESSKIPTDEQKYLLVDYYAKWRIDNIPLYYTRTGGYPRRARILLTQKINDALRAAFGKRSLRDVVSAERSDIMDIIKKSANQSASDLGVRVVDTRIKGIDLLQQVEDSVYQRMRTKREQVATKYRYQGKAEAEKIRAEADAKARISIATAATLAQKARASGDLKASTIYTNAYNQNPSFYAFYRSLRAYKQVFSKRNTIMVLRPNNEFFQYLGLTNHKQRTKLVKG